MTRRLTSLLVLAGSLALTGAACGGDSTATSQAPEATTLQATYVRVVESVSPSVVQIETSRGLGSGIVFDERGDIVTNAHVVGDAKQFRVTTRSGRRLDASLVGRWAPGDLAVIRASGGGDLKPARFADSSRLEVGDIVLAVGNPLGLRSSVTNGIVSSLGRTVSEGRGVTLPSAIQTSAAINPGNSGGALVDIDGDVVGVPTLAALDPELGGSQAPGIGFAIPSNTVKSIAGQLIDDGRVTRSDRASLGIRAATVTGGGVAIVSVAPDGPADAAGLERGQIIVSVNGKSTPAIGALGNVLAGLKPGERVPVTVLDPQGGKRTVQITLGQLTA
jgi:putative serine protease PepD